MNLQLDEVDKFLVYQRCSIKGSHEDVRSPLLLINRTSLTKVDTDKRTLVSGITIFGVFIYFILTILCYLLIDF